MHFLLSIVRVLQNILDRYLRIFKFYLTNKTNQRSEMHIITTIFSSSIAYLSNYCQIENRLGRKWEKNGSKTMELRDTKKYITRIDRNLKYY